MQETHGNNPPAASAGRKLWLIPAILLFVVAVAAGAWLAKGSSGSVRGAEQPRTHESGPAADVHVEVIKPSKGVLERSTSQAGTVMAFHGIDIISEVSGYLRELHVDIGSRVTKGQLMAVIDVPELKARVDQKEAAKSLADAQVEQKSAAIDSSKAELKVAEAKLEASKARNKQDVAYLKFRAKQKKRYEDLLASGSIEARLVDEQEDHYDAAVEAVNASREAINAAAASIKFNEAKILQAGADLKEAQAKVKVAQAELDDAKVMEQFSRLVAPFDGVITFRKDTFDVGTFVRAASPGTSPAPLLTVQSVDKMRMVVPIPDRDVPYCSEGAPAIVTFDALPNYKFTASVSRTGKSEDLTTKTMRAEIDIANKEIEVTRGGRKVKQRPIRQGMYGNVTITLARVENAVSIPSSCLVGKAEGGKASVYVVKDGKAHLREIEIGLDNGINVEVIKGLAPEDSVVYTYSGGIGDDVAVEATEVSTKTAKAASH